MLKTVKVKKNLRLDELIKYIFDNGIEDKVFPSNGGSSFDMCEARISGSGNIKTSGYINEHTTFTVEVEEEIDDNTYFENLVELEKDGQLNLWFDMTLGASKSDGRSEKVYALIDNNLQLIWEADSDVN